MASTPVPTPAPAPVVTKPAIKMYTIQDGDTLWDLAYQTYGDGTLYTKIFNVNTNILTDPDTIFVGQQIVIPN
jgi:nucleoid-associated protein YgaU